MTYIEVISFLDAPHWKKASKNETKVIIHGR